MPIIHLELHGTEQTVTRPVVQDVVEDLVVGFGLPESTTVHYPTGSEPEQIPQSLRDRIGEGAGDPRQNVRIEAQESFLEEDIHKTVINPRHAPVLFRDAAIGLEGVALTAIMVRCRVELSMTFSQPDRATAVRQQNHHRFFASKDRLNFFHEVHYDFQIPQAVLALLHQIHTLRESRAGYGDTFYDYMQAHLAEQMTVYSTQDQSHYRIGKEEVQTNILGNPDFSVGPEDIQRNDQTGSYEYSFNYTFDYDKPIMVVMQYPLSVHNQPIPQRFYDHMVEFEMARRAVGRDKITKQLDHWTNHRERTLTTGGLPIPHFHSWYPSLPPHMVQGIARILLLIDGTNPYTLFSFHDLGRVTLDDKVITLLEEEHAYVSKYRQSVFYLGLYENDNPKSDDYVTVNPDLSVTLDYDIDPRKEYHAYFGIYLDWVRLTRSALDRFRQHGAIVHYIAQAIEPRLRDSNKLPPIRKDGSISRSDMLKLGHEINRRHTTILGEPRMNRFRVGAFYINANSQES